jgi:hypothetical protein
VDYGALLAQPDAFGSRPAARKTELRDVKIRACLSTRARAVLDRPQREHFQATGISGYADRRNTTRGSATTYRATWEKSRIIIGGLSSLRISSSQTCEVDATDFQS